MNQSQISESEWIIMELLWKSPSKTAFEVTKDLELTTGWAVNTVRTMLTRLIKKGILSIDENQSGTRVFSPKVKRDECIAIESKSFAKRFFGGASKSLFVHFAQHSDLSSTDVEELKRLLDDSANNKPMNK